MAYLKSLIASIFLLLTTTLAALSNFDDWPHQRIQLEDVSIHFRYYGSGPPLLLVHGFPQHSLTWHTIGPMLAQNYTVIAPDIRGMGDSSLSKTANYTARAAGSDLKAILDFLNIEQTYVFAHDKGGGLAASLAIEHPEVVARLILSEYPLPGFGYPTTVYSPDLFQNWQLAFFAVPDAAEFFISGKEKEMLSWYFFHASYSGTAAVSEEHLNRYTSQISKPGFLRSGMMYFGAAWEDEAYFKTAFNNGTNRLPMPFLALGGEASLAQLPNFATVWGQIAEDYTAEAIPKAGHWIGKLPTTDLESTFLLTFDAGDENPAWTARRAGRFFDEAEHIPNVDLSYLADTVSLVNL